MGGRLRVAVAGCGLIGARRAAVAARQHEVVSVFDVDRARAALLADGVGARVADSLPVMLGAGADCVIVATTHDALAATALAALEHGSHVLVEKPGARSAAELEPVVVAARERGLIAKVGFNHRYHPAIAKAHVLASEGALGPLLWVRGRYGHGGRPGYDDEWRFQREISGGGELIDQGTHLVDLACWFLGDLDLRLALLPSYFWRATVEDNCFLALQSAAGQVAWLHASWTEWKNTFSFEVTGRDGKLVVEGLGGSYGTERLTHYRMLPGMGPPETTTWEFPSPDTSWEREFDDLVDAIASGRLPLSDAAETLRCLRLVDEAYRETQR
jgi:predicted dehydrogenase